MREPYDRVMDVASFSTVLLTAILFIIALFEKGFTHDILLEAGVFLISVKLVLGLQKGERMSRSIRAQLDLIEDKIDRALKNNPRSNRRNSRTYQQDLN